MKKYQDPVMAHRRWRRHVLGMLLAAAIIPRYGAGQDRAQAAPPIQHDVSVSLKLIRVFVTDATGRPATNLRVEDFRILDNGTPQRIQALETYVDASAPERASAARIDGTNASATPAAAPVSLPAAPQIFIFLFDTGNNDMQGLSMASRAAIRFLDEKLRPGDAAAVVSMAGIGGIDLVQFLTTDLAKVRAAIDRVRAVPGRRWLAEIEINGSRPDSGRTEQEKEAASQNRSMSPFRVYAKMMPVLAKAFSLVEGTKNVIFFSAGISSFPAGAYAGRLMAAANMPVFAINSEIGKNSTAILPDMNAPAEEANPTGQSTLEQVAALSGGRSFGLTNALTRFDQIADAIDTAVRNYYIIAYSVRADWKGQYHQVQVEILKPGFTAHAQSGYYDTRPSAPAESRK